MKTKLHGYRKILKKDIIMYIIEKTEKKKQQQKLRTKSEAKDQNNKTSVFF